MRKSFQSLYLLLTLLMSFLAIQGRAQNAELQQHLQDQYQNKIFLLRGFYSGNHLRYSPTGVSDSTKSGDWTTDGFLQLDEVRVSSQGIAIKARRMLVIAVDQKGFLFRIEDSPKKHKKKAKDTVILEVATETGSATLAEQVDAALGRVFLTIKDNFADMLPDYWRPCVWEGLRGKSQNCHFSPDLTAVPGVATLVDSNPIVASSQSLMPSPTASLTKSVDDSTVGVAQRQGVSPPEPLRQQEPAFSELARQAKVQGVVTLGLTIDKAGNPTKIRILNPLGAGLDVQAINAVSNWRFKPAQKGGEPVAAEIAVEVDFHLY